MKTLKLNGKEMQIACCAIGIIMLIYHAQAGGCEAAEIMEARAQLKTEMAKRGSSQENPSLIKKLRIKIARSGDEVERQNIITELKDKDPVRQAEAIAMARSIGGVDMMCGLAELLDDATGYSSLDKQQIPEGLRPQGDIVYSPPCEQAANALAHLVEDPPVPPIGKDKKIYTKEDILKWRRWWDANRTKFETHR